MNGEMKTRRAIAEKTTKASVPTQAKDGMLYSEQERRLLSQTD